MEKFIWIHKIQSKIFQFSSARVNLIYRNRQVMAKFRRLLTKWGRRFGADSISLSRWRKQTPSWFCPVQCHFSTLFKFQSLFKKADCQSTCWVGVKLKMVVQRITRHSIFAFDRTWNRSSTLLVLCRWPNISSLVRFEDERETRHRP